MNRRTTLVAILLLLPVGCASRQAAPDTRTADELLAEAREAADKVLKINPNLSVVSLEKTLPYKNKADRDLIVNGLRKAGLK